jgi:hypothetical protein
VRVLRVALSVRLLAFLGIFSLGVGGAQQSWLAVLGFLGAALPWALLSVSSTALTAHLSLTDEGSGMGLLNAVTAWAGIVGAVLGGWCATWWGYNTAAGLAVACLALGLSLTPAFPAASGGGESDLA